MDDDPLKLWRGGMLAQLWGSLSPKVTTLAEGEPNQDRVLTLDKLQRVLDIIKPPDPHTTPHYVDIPLSLEANIAQDLRQIAQPETSLFGIPIYARTWVPENEIWVVMQDGTVTRYRIKS